MTPAQRVREDLAAARRHGKVFAEAWPAATARAVAGQRRDEAEVWNAAFTATVAAWEAAWHRRAATRAQRAVHALAVDDERVPMPEHGECACGTALPPPRHGPQRKWCSDGCRRAASRVALAA
jgi:hypothetical protein